MTMSMPLTPPYTPLTSSSVFDSTPKDKYPAPPHGHSFATALLTPPHTPESITDAITSHFDQARPASGQFGGLLLGQQHSEPEGSSRSLSDNELSYYLPSRGDGVNDMYLHHTLSARRPLMTPSRLLYIWAYQLLRHPLLASYIRYNDYEDISFISPRAESLTQALSIAASRFSHLSDERDIIDTYLNGPRTLSNERLGYLVVKAQSQALDSADEDKASFEFMLCATHYLGDGMALHTFMNEFYTLLGSDKTIEDISTMINAQLDQGTTSIPASMEERLPLVGDGSKLARVVGMEEYKRSEARLIGGQSFGSNPIKGLERKTVVPTISYDAARTKAILGKCKTQGVTIAHAAFALCNLAWARKTNDAEAPCLIYSALNLRPNMLPSPTASSDSFFHLAVGYFNIVLPTLLPSSLSAAELFWHRARMTKQQTIKAVKTPFVVARSRETSIVRKTRAVKWAKVDDEEEAQRASTQSNAGLGLGLSLPSFDAPKANDTEGGDINKQKKRPEVLQLPTPEVTPVLPAPSSEPKSVSQKALMGLSMLGNLDGMYKHASFPELQLTSLTTGSRQRSGGLLLFAYTFAGKLWFSLGYDSNGFPPGVIEGFWAEVQTLIDEILV